MIWLPTHSTIDDNICCLWCFEMIWLPIHSTTDDNICCHMITYSQYNWWQYLLSVVFWMIWLPIHRQLMKYCHQVVLCVLGNYLFTVQLMTIFVVCGVLRWKHHRQQILSSVVFCDDMITYSQYNWWQYLLSVVFWDDMITYSQYNWWQYLLSVVFWDDMITYSQYNWWQYCCLWCFEIGMITSSHSTPQTTNIVMLYCGR